MKFLLDQSTDARLGRYLKAQGHEASRIGSDYPGGIKDEEVLKIAFSEQSVLITEDADFAKLVFIRKQEHSGIIHIRLGPRTPLSTKIERLNDISANHTEELNQFLEVTLNSVETRQ